MSGGTGVHNFTTTSLPTAVANLFRLNHYDVEEDVHIHGAQIDLVATPRADPFGQRVYIEVTIEYVNATKYGKDSTKFILVREKDPSARCLCISSSGFTPDVKERAKASRIEALTYDEVFRLFEKFTPYVTRIGQDAALATLVKTYEEPNFADSIGKHKATEWLNLWRGYKKEGTRWLLLLGEYGTGKTALTKVLQSRWIDDYVSNPTSPIPIRIELRNFTRQFDASGLIHHFLDTNGLSHIPIEFMLHLIRTGRTVLLLDGYDEMAQFMNARERRACLGALADLAADGAKGLLTSRPNYFSEHEELNVFEALYKTIEQNRYYISHDDRALIEKEKAVDELVERYVLNRYERNLEDLSPEQTRTLVRRTLSNDKNGQEIVLGILDRIFREERRGGKQSLSGKPVIISYLLELVEELRKKTEDFDFDELTEWQVYKLIVDRLMLRDMTRTPMNPDTRRGALQQLALALSGRSTGVATEEVFFRIINEEFSSELRLLQAEERRTRRVELFEDLRSSATLTRAGAGGGSDGWNFSHNSLREFLAAERLIYTLLKREPVRVDFPISQPMRAFVASMSPLRRAEIWSTLLELWPQRMSNYQLGPYLNLFWDALVRGEPSEILDRLEQLSVDTDHGRRVQLGSIELRDADLRDLGVKVINGDFTKASFQDCVLAGIDLGHSDFRDAVFDTVSFRDSDLRYADFRGSLIFECDFTNCRLEGADFTGVDGDINIVIGGDTDAPTPLSGHDALGYVASCGATVGSIAPFYVYQHHPRFPIVMKIIEKVSEQKNSQLRGLTQRGEAQADPPFARGLIDRMQSLGWLQIDRHELVSLTQVGRPIVQRMRAHKFLPEEISKFLSDWT